MDQLRELYEAYAEAHARERALVHAGRKARAELDRVDGEHGAVTGGDLLGEARAARDAATGSAARDAARRLALLLEAAVVAAATREASAELDARAAAATVDAAGRRLPLALADAALAAEPDPDARRRLEDAADAAERTLEPLRAELHAATGRALARLGHATPRAAAEARRPGVDLDAWGGIARRVLDATESDHRARLRDALARIGVARPERARRADLEPLVGLETYRPRLRADVRGPALDLATEGLGARLNDLGAVSFDDEPRPDKRPAAATFALRVPQEVLVVLGARDGVAGFEALLGEAGRALQLAFTSPSLPVERRRLSDPAVARLWRQLLAGRLHDPAWIAAGPLAPEAARFERDVRLRRAIELRRTAARATLELRLAALAPGDDPSPLGEVYAEEMTAATGVAHTPAGFLRACGAGLTSLDELRARCLHATLEERLREGFGLRWYRERAAFELLKELWNTGGTYDAEALAAELGLGAIGPDPLLVELDRA